MGFKRKLYPAGGKTNSARSGYGSAEIDLRAEFDNLIFGGGGSIPHGRDFLLRKVRRDSDKKPIKCTCVDRNQGSGLLLPILLRRRILLG